MKRLEICGSDLRMPLSITGAPPRLIQVVVEFMRVVRYNPKRFAVLTGMDLSGHPGYSQTNGIPAEARIRAGGIFHRQNGRQPPTTE
jgi:hypothetical protein